MFTFTPLLPSTTPATSSLLTLSSDLKILIDIGWDQSLETSQLELLEQHVSTLSLVLLTHATTECIGAYAHCCKHLPGFSRIPCYATTPVINLGRTLLTDLYASTTTSSLIPGSKTLLLPSPTPDEITAYFNAITALKYLQPHTPLSPSLTASQPLTLTPHAAGHTLGGTIWHLHHTPDSIIYASHWSQTRENLIPGAALLSSDGSGVVEPLLRPTALVCSARGVERGEGLGKRARDERLVGLVRECVAKGGKVVIPTDSGGRMLELAFLLNGMWEAGLSGSHAETWRNARCFLATRSAGGSVRYLQSMLEWVEDGVRSEAEAAMTAQGQQGGRQGGGRDGGGKVVNPMEWRHIRFLERESRVKRVVESTKPCVLLASDSSMDWGFARQALVALAKDPKNLVILTEEQNTGSGLGRQLWDLYNSSQSSGGNGGAKVVSPDGVSLSFQEATTTTTLTPDERAAYETYATKQRLRHSELQGDNTNPDPTAAGDEIVDLQDEAEESSDSEDDDEGDEDAEHQGRALNLSAQLNVQAQKKNKLASAGGAGVADAELGVNVLLRGRVVDGKGKVVGQVHDYDVRGRKGREKVFPFVVGRRRGDEFGEVVRGEEYLRAEEKVEGMEVEGGGLRGGEGRGAVGGKRKWGDDGAGGGGGRRRGDSRSDGRGGKRVKRGEGGGVGGAGDDIDAAIARATGEGGAVGGGAGGGEEGSSDDDEESDYDPDDAISAPDAPRKVVYTPRTLEVRCRISYVDFSALHDLRALLMIVPLMRPRKVILTAGSEGEMGSLARAFGEVEVGGERGLEVVVGRVGEVVDASVDTNAWTLKLGRGLVRRLRWQEVKGLGVVAVTGWLGVEGEGGEVDEGVKAKKMKLVKGEEEEDEGDEAKAVVKVGKGDRMPVLDLLSTITSSASLSSAVQPTRPVHVGDTRLADLRAQLRLSGHEAQFSGEGTLLIDGCVVVRKSGDLAGRLEIESVGMQAVGGFEEVRRKVYGGLAVVGGV
ncbi:hypothetical protein LTS10_001712 [Elasticomyces elasticus]|nr:hypothetical protein LTS10_001712 [Elasticomyces elasticus]